MQVLSTHRAGQRRNHALFTGEILPQVQSEPFLSRNYDKGVLGLPSRLFLYEEPLRETTRSSSKEAGALEFTQYRDATVVCPGCRGRSASAQAVEQGSFATQGELSRGPQTSQVVGAPLSLVLLPTCSEDVFPASSRPCGHLFAH